MNPTETKRIGHTTYIKRGNLLAEVKGPYRPGNVWKAEVYTVKPAFAEAWAQGKLTAVQRGKVDAQTDRVIAALSFGQCNAVDPDLYVGLPLCLDYRYETKRAAVAAVQAYFQKA